ncbi:MAG: PmbA/TldA family metallopeptidase, partial [Candidatus Aminicenantales bacterium]
MEKSLSTALEKTFNLNLANLYHILNLALSQGGDFSEIYLEHSIYSYINMEDDIIKETAENISQGLGIRVISGEKTGFGYTNSFSLNKVRKVAQTAASIANHTKSISISQLIPLQMQHNFYPIQIPARETTIKTKISLVKKTYSAAQGFSRYIKKVKVNLVDKLQTVIIANSEGTVTFD